MPVSDVSDLRNLLASAAADASSLALSYFRRGVVSKSKADGSPVTEADLAVDAFLRERLMAARPDFGWLSEETADNPERLDKRMVFVVDPIDGTRAFMSRLEDWTISLAIVLDGRPVAGVVAEPVPGRVYAAAAGQGATLNGVTLAMREASAIRGLTMAGPKPMTDLISRHGGMLVPKIHSLALRIARVGGGDLDAAFVGGRSRDWDLEAADLIVQEAGGLLADLKGQPPVYNLTDSAHSALIAAAHPLHGPLRDLAKP